MSVKKHIFAVLAHVGQCALTIKPSYFLLHKDSLVLPSPPSCCLFPRVPAVSAAPPIVFSSARPLVDSDGKSTGWPRPLFATPLDSLLLTSTVPSQHGNNIESCAAYVPDLERYVFIARRRSHGSPCCQLHVLGYFFRRVTRTVPAVLTFQWMSALER